MAYERALPNGPFAAVKQEHQEKGKKGHAGSVQVQNNEPVIAEALAQGLDDGLTAEGADVYHGVEDGITAGPVGRRGFPGHGSGDDRLDEGASHHDYDHHGEEEPLLPARIEPVENDDLPHLVL